jgi:mannose/cellobiose epimerase-like protein (N-acyl-D-glucosamine 2-epimerase family)
VLHDLALDRAWAQDWLFRAALPLWWEKGFDNAQGGWFDKLDQLGQPLDLPKRLRVQARQSYVYAEAGRLDWDGPWKTAVSQGVDYMLDRYRREDGLFRASVMPDGRPFDDHADLYDQAFVLFALAAAYDVLGRPTGLHEEALQLLTHLEVALAHPFGGFEEATPRVLPLRSNPQMHLLEALLAWVEVGGGALFDRHARRIVDLACERLIDSKTGGIGEYYDGEWAFDPTNGHVREPGHQFEWAYLLHAAGNILDQDHRAACRRLHDFGEAHGIRDGRTIFSTEADGAPLDSSSRLWSQTERLRTALLLAPAMEATEQAAAMSAARDAITTLKRMLDTPTPGLWFDRIDAVGTVMNEPAPASSLYHLVTGMVPLISPERYRAADIASGTRHSLRSA